MLILLRAIEEKPGSNQQELAKVANLQSSSTSRTIRDLERRKWVRSKENREGRGMSKHYYLTSRSKSFVT